MAHYVKLGGKASIFFDPSTGLKVTGKKIVKITGNGKFSKKIDQAIKGGHLEKVSKTEYEEYLESLEVTDVQTVKAKNSTEEEEDDVNSWVENYEDFSEKALKALKNDQLVALAIHLGSEIEEDELTKMKKAELVEEIQNLVEEEEEEEEEE